jgi:hypothetical protein
MHLIERTGSIGKSIIHHGHIALRRHGGCRIQALRKGFDGDLDILSALGGAVSTGSSL